MSFLQNLLISTRKKYINRLNAYELADLSIGVENLKIYKELPEWLKKELIAWVANEVESKQTKWYSNKLYLLHFNENLTTDQAERELSKLGFFPATILETVYFFDKYEKNINDWPIISLNSYHDFSSSFPAIYKEMSHPGIGLCLCRMDKNEFGRPGEIEFNENIGHGFKAGTSFLVKER